MCSIIGVGERLHKVLGQIGSKLWFPWQQKAPVDLKWGKWCLHLFLVVFDPVLLILASNEDMHKISDEFEFRSDRTTDYGVSCPWVSKKFPIDIKWENGVCMLAHSFLIKSSSKLLVTRTGIKARMSLISVLWFPWPIYMFFEMRFDLGTLDSGERSLPFGLLVSLFQKSCIVPFLLAGQKLVRCPHHLSGKWSLCMYNLSLSAGLTFCFCAVPWLITSF